MALVSFIANLERLTVAVERLSLDVSHGIRILENVFPLAHAEARWKPPSEELHIADDQA
jgi:hypothetical protein